MFLNERTEILFGVFVCSTLLLMDTLSRAEPMPEFHLYSGSIRVTDISGHPVKGVAVYGYCEDLHLIWPRTPDNQYTLAWKQDYFARSDENGEVQTEVPRGEWTFVAVGLTQVGEVLCVAGSVNVSKQFSITLTPATTFESTYGLGAIDGPDSDGLLTKLFIMHAPVPLYVQLPIKTGKAIGFQTAPENNFHLWGKGYTEDNKTSFLANFRKIEEGKNQSLSLNQIVFKGDIKHSLDLKWIRRWHEGLEETIKIEPGQRFAVSNGECSIGYKRKIENYWCDFVSKYYDLSGAEKISFVVNDNLRVNLWTQTKDADSLVQLFMIDGNGFHIKKIFDGNGQVLKFDANLKQGDRVLEGKPYPRDMSFAFEDYKMTDNESWAFSIPLGALKDKWFKKTDFVEPSGRYFTMKVPRDLTSYAVNYLEQLDDFSKKMQHVCGRKKQVQRTKLLLNVESRTSGELHGKNIATANHVLYRDFPLQRHSFPHEMAHNFGFHHGGLQETVVEVSRSAADFIIYGQESKWLFIDRMNDKKRNEKWYPYTAIYLWGYSQGQKRFLKVLSRYEYSLFKAGEESGFSKEEITAAMFSLFLRRDMFEVSTKYGLCSDRSRYDGALNCVRGYLATHKR